MEKLEQSIEAGNLSDTKKNITFANIVLALLARAWNNSGGYMDTVSTKTESEGSERAWL